MNKTIKALLLSSMIIGSAQADFLMTLTDKDGIETSQCVKSYSFSNNLESLHKEQNQIKDVYSTEETLTNKTYMGYPVYRRVMPIADFSVPQSSNGQYQFTEVVSNDLKSVVEMSFHAIKNGDQLLNSSNTQYVIFDYGGHILYQVDFYYSTKKAGLYFRHTHDPKTWHMTDARVTIEYTKTTDEALVTDKTVDSLVNYLPSNSNTGEYLVQSLDDATIGFKKNYTYDSNTDSCIAPTN